MRQVNLWLVIAGFSLFGVACGGSDSEVRYETDAATMGTMDGGTPDAAEMDASEDAAVDGAIAECTMLPEVIEEDLTVGPECVRISRSHVRGGATLTIVPGTRVEMLAAGYLLIGDRGTADALVAVGTADEPITFTSAAETPAAGDWECVRFGGESAGSDLAFVNFEYGGAPCNANGADKEGMIVVNAPIRGIKNASFRNSSSHGVHIEREGAVRTFEDTTFGSNGSASIFVDGSQVLTLGERLTFEDAEDNIDVDSTFSLKTSGTWRAQPVAYHVEAGYQIDNGSMVVMEAGVTVAMRGGSFEVFDAELRMEGASGNPVTFTSAQTAPVAGRLGLHPLQRDSRYASYLECGDRVRGQRRGLLRRQSSCGRGRASQRADRIDDLP